jgi:GTPase SAR1 family protein
MGCACCSQTSLDTRCLRVVLFGLENSGKTSLAQCLRLSSNNTSKRTQTVSTHGVIAMNLRFTGRTSMNLLLFDCGGCKHQRHMWPHLSNEADLILFVIDSADFVCLRYARDALFDLLADESLSNRPLLIVFNKSDQQTNIDVDRLERQLDLSLINVSPTAIDRILHVHSIEGSADSSALLFIDHTNGRVVSVDMVCLFQSLETSRQADLRQFRCLSISIEISSVDVTRSVDIREFSVDNTSDRSARIPSCFVSIVCD